MIVIFTSSVNNSNNWSLPSSLKLLDYCLKLPASIEELTAEEICGELLKPFASCDCPCMLGEYLITAEGDNVVNYMENLSEALLICEGRSIETWT